MIKIEDFIDDLKEYLKESIIALDPNFSKLKVKDAYDETTPVVPEIRVMVFDFSEDEPSNSFNSENISSFSCNIYAYATAMKFDNNQSKTSAQMSTTALASDISNVLDKHKLRENNNNIISSRRANYSGAMEIQDSTSYVAAFVYEFKVINNYNKVYRKGE